MHNRVNCPTGNSLQGEPLIPAVGYGSRTARFIDRSGQAVKQEELAAGFGNVGIAGAIGSEVIWMIVGMSLVIGSLKVLEALCGEKRKAYNCLFRDTVHRE